MDYPKSIHTELYVSEQTYKEASSKIKSKAIRSFLEGLARSKNKFRRQLPLEDESFKDSERISKRKTVIGTNNTYKILVECLNKEEGLIKEYQKTLTTNQLDKNHYQVISRQLNNALKAFNQLRAIKLSAS